MTTAETKSNNSTMHYIEVTGEGSFTETASKFVAEVRFEVRAAKDETSFREVAELAREAISLLREQGIHDDEIVEGGADFQRPWYWKKNVGQTAVRKVILKVADYSKLNGALEKLEPLQSRNKERKTISVDMKQPEFDVSTDAKTASLASAYEDARAKAVRLATVMNRSLGEVVSLEEGGWAKRNSGFSGDEDWGGDASRFALGGGVVLAAAGAAAESPESDLMKPTRTIFVKCRVRFALPSPTVHA